MKIYTDGGSRGNPGKSACAFVVVSEGKIVKEYSEYLGIGTNNEAEYKAVILALTVIKAKDIEIVSDSELVVRQLNNEYKVRKPHLQELKEKVDELVKNRNVRFSNVRRVNEFVSRADFLVNQELDKH